MAAPVTGGRGAVVAADGQPDDGASPPAAPAAGCRPLRAVVADDAVDVRTLLRLQLRAEGVDVVAEAADGEQAVALTETHRPDVVVLDVGMPVMDGVQALREIRRRCPQVPVVMHSGDADPGTARRCLAAGAAAFCDKGSRPQELAGVLREAVLRSTCAVGPAAVGPAADDPAADDPAADDAAVDVPVADVPAVDVPVADDPAVDVAAADHRDGAGPPRPARRTLLGGRGVLPLAVALFAAVLVARLGIDPGNPANALGLLYVLPIGLLAVRFGVRGGAVAAGTAVLLTGVAVVAVDMDPTPLSLLPRVVVFVLVGVLLGIYADRAHALIAAQRAASAQLVAANQRLADALELSRRNVVALEVANGDLRQFGYVASHDLAEPLRSMAGFAQLLESDYAGVLDERGLLYLRQIHDGSSRMRALIEDLRAYTRAGQQELLRSPVPLAAVLDDVCAGLRAVLDERGAVVVGTGLPTVRGDRSMLALVLQNLVSNAVKFNRSPQPTVQLSARRLGDAWQVDVADNGIGIPPAHREKVFGLFSRLHTRDDFPGTGLGLAICRRIVERHDGAVEVVPTTGGTVVRLLLPAVDGDR